MAVITFRTMAHGDTQAELEADARRQAREFFGGAMPLITDGHYVVLQALDGAGSPAARYRAVITVRPEREPLAQSEAAERVRRQIQYGVRWIQERYGQ